MVRKSTTPTFETFLITIQTILDRNYTKKNAKIVQSHGSCLPEDPAFSTGVETNFQMQIALYWINL